jgi:DUF4097 and DUF4098 domain-containing protein YvlB
VRARKILLLLFILLFGATVETAWRVRSHVELGPLGWRVLGGRFYGPSFDFTETQTIQVPAGVKVVVRNSFGGVKLDKGAPGAVSAALRKVVFLPTQGEAQALADRVKLHAVLEGSTLTLSTNRGDLEREGALGEAGLETHWQVAVPEASAAEVNNEHGRIDVSDVARADVDGSFEAITVERVAGDANVKGRHGEVTASSIGGALTLSGRYGDATVRDVTGRANVDGEHGNVRVERVGSLTLSLKHGDLEAETIKGDAEVHGEHSAARISDVGGAARVETSFDDVHLARVSGEARVKTEHGAVEAKDVQGPVTVEATFDDVSLSSVGGHADVKVEHGGLHATSLAKGATVRASGDDVTLDGFRGGARIVASRGSVRLVPDEAINAPISVTAEHGGIALDVPPGSRFDLLASARPGNVSVNVSDFIASESGASRVKGRVGQGGSAVTLEAQHGDVTVEPKGSSESREN